MEIFVQLCVKSSDIDNEANTNYLESSLYLLEREHICLIEQLFWVELSLIL